MSDTEDKRKKTAEMIKYENETGKKAIWRGTVTESFKKWKKGERVYSKDKERINILVSEETKKSWQEFANNNNIPTLSKLIRASVELYMNTNLKDLQNLSHFMKEKLNSIVGYSQLLMEEYKDELSWDLLKKIKELILDQGLELEKKINTVFESKKQEENYYEILVVDDDDTAIELLKEYFNRKGYICKTARLGNEALEYLKNFTPKVILLDVILPDINGYDVLRQIKLKNKNKDIPVFFITAVQESEVQKQSIKLGAEGYITKPFKWSEFEKIFKYLKEE